MIGVSLGELMLACVGLALVFVSAWWLVAVSNVREDEAKKHEGVITCRICGVRYEAYAPRPSRWRRAAKGAKAAISNGHGNGNGNSNDPHLSGNGGNGESLTPTQCPACGTLNEWQPPGII